MTSTFRHYAITPATNGNRLVPRQEKAPAPDGRQVAVRIEAASLNYRDLLILKGYLPARDGLIPLSDAAGTVVEVGPAVSRWKVGDRVMPAFFPGWTAGRFDESYGALGGGEIDGVLTELGLFDENALVAVPDHLSLAEAATLPCAALTAWHALVGRGQLAPEDTVLIQGTGGVALFALQIATAIGARAIVLSSSDDKRKMATELGAWATINYRDLPDWDVEVRRLTDGRGVDHVIELGGPDTFDRSLRAVAAGGHIAQIGVFTGFGSQSNLIRLQLINADIHGIGVGSAEQFAAMNRFFESHRVRPVIDRSFSFELAADAYEHLASARHFGKVVVTL
jgi:NADPH:quinone reductase-like Zn-dependent oxidoreductase